MAKCLKTEIWCIELKLSAHNWAGTSTTAVESISKAELKGNLQVENQQNDPGECSQFPHCFPYSTRSWKTSRSSKLYFRNLNYKVCAYIAKHIPYWQDCRDRILNS
jgi:hypothetical protein